jgi:prolyl oligopeptidase
VLAILALAALAAAQATAVAPNPAAAPAPAATPAPALRYPETRRGDAVDDYFGVRVPDPYRWLEDDDAEETRAWVKAENAVTQAFLEATPERPAIRARLERPWDHERFSRPEKKGAAGR